MRSLEQIRSARAFAALSVDGLPREDARLAVRLPTMLRTNGLLATWAFLLKKGKDKKREPPLLRQVAEHLEAVLGQRAGLTSTDPEKAFLAWIESGDNEGGTAASTLRELTSEASALAAWMKRAAEILHPGVGQEEDDDA